MRLLSRPTVVLIALFSAAGAHAAAISEAPKSDVLASATIPDLDRFLGHLEEVGALFSPGAVAPGMAKGLLAAQLGDPGLASLGSGPLLGLMLPGTGAPQFAVFLPVKTPAAYEAAFAKQGWKTRSDQGLLAAAATPEALDAAWAARDRYRAVAAAPALAHDLRIDLQADRLVATFGPLMEMGLASMSAPAHANSKPPAGSMDPAQAQRIVALEMKGLFAALQAAETLRLDLDVDGTALTNGTYVKFKPGSSLAALASMPVSGPSAMGGLLSESDLLAYEWRVDAKKVSVFLTQLLDGMAQDPQTAEFVSAEMRSLVADMSRCLTGEMALAVRPSGVWGEAETAMTVADEAACLAMVEKGIALTAGADSPFEKMYAELGLSFSLQKKTRSHAGVPVHAMKTSRKGPPAADGPDPLASPMMASMLRGSEFAFTHGYYLSSQDPARLDTLIDRAAGPHPAAGKGIGLLPNANMTGSYDFVAMMKAMLTSLPGAKAQAFADLPASEPVRFAMTLSGGAFEARWRMPMAPFAAMAAAAQKSKAAALRDTQEADPDEQP